MSGTTTTSTFIWVTSFCAVLSGLALLYTVTLWILIYTYRQKPIVAMSQPVFLYNICGGSLLIVLSMIANICVLANSELYSIDDNGVTTTTSTMSNLSLLILCDIHSWAVTIGLALVFTALLCKIYRIKLITDQPLRRGVKVLPKHVMIPYATIMVTIISLLIAWVIVIHFYDPYTEDDYDKSCQSQNKSDRIFSNVIFGLIGCVSVAVTILAWKIRHINEELGDSKRILWLSVYLFCFAIIHSILLILPIIPNIENVKIQLAVLDAYDTLKSFLISIGIMSFIVLPRIYCVWYEYKHGHLPAGVEMIGAGRTTVNT